MDNFLPDPNYKLPSTSKYMKFSAPGDYTFRVLSSAIVGWEYFTNENKPVRQKEEFESMPSDIKKGGSVKPFWAFVVYNYEEEKVQILELSQKTIMGQMLALVKNPKWGNPQGYDITITRKGTTMNDTEYAVIPNPHTPVDSKIVVPPFDLNALYFGNDPFDMSKQYHPIAGEIDVPLGEAF